MDRLIVLKKKEIEVMFGTSPYGNVTERFKALTNVEIYAAF